MWQLIPFLFSFPIWDHSHSHELEFFLNSKTMAFNDVKSVTISQLKKDSTWLDSHEFHFDNSGNRIKERTFIIDYSTTWNYDTLNAVVENIDSTRIKEKGKYKILNQYNSNNQIVKQTLYFDIKDKEVGKNIIIDYNIIENTKVGVFEAIEYQYNTDSTVKNRKSIHYSYETIDTVFVSFEYDSQKNLVQINTENQCIIYTYNRKGYVKRKKEYSNPNGHLLSQSKLKYNADGLLRKKINFEFDKLYSTEVYAYNNINMLESSLITYPRREATHRKYYYTYFD